MAFTDSIVAFVEGGCALAFVGASDDDGCGGGGGGAATEANATTTTTPAVKSRGDRRHLGGSGSYSVRFVDPETGTNTPKHTQTPHTHTHTHNTHTQQQQQHTRTHICTRTHHTWSPVTDLLARIRY